MTVAATMRTAGKQPADRAERALQRHGHRFWRGAGALAAAVTLVAGTYQVVTQLAHEEETLTAEIDGSAISRVEIDNGTSGRVSVVGTDSGTIDMTARVSHGLRSTGHSARVVGDRFVIGASCPNFGSSFCRATYQLEVPEGVSVVIHSEGRVSVSDIDGPVTVSTDNGSVEATRIRGDVDLSSDNGRVVATGLFGAVGEGRSDNGRVELGFAEPPRTVVADSDNGRVEVVLPDRPGVAYRVELSSDNGTESLQVDTASDSPRSVTARSDNGDVTVRYQTED